MEKSKKSWVVSTSNVLNLIRDEKIKVNSGALIRGSLTIKGHVVIYNKNKLISRSIISIGCLNIDLDKFNRLKSHIESGFEDKEAKAIIKIGGKSKRCNKVNVYKEESESFYISTTGRSYKKLDHEIKLLPGYSEFPLDSKGNYLFKDGWSSMQKIKPSDVKIYVDIISDYIDFIDNNQLNP